MNTSSFSGRSILVTGAAGALGKSLVRHLTGQGDRVAAVDVPSSADFLRALVDELGASVMAVPMDVAAAQPADAWPRAIDRIEAGLGPIAGAVLVAGSWRGGTSFAKEGDDGVWRAMMEVNLETAQRSLRALLPKMIARRTGSVVVIGSRAAAWPWTSGGASAYAASKAAVVALAQAVAAEVIESGVRINAVLPSTLDTPANRSAMPGADTSRWVSTESLSGVIAFLLSDGARDVSGAAIPVYGRA